MNYFVYIMLFLLGVVFGSFYHVLGTRLPKGESIIKPGSHCEFCDHELQWYELIPIFSFLIQKGKCRNCGHSLSSSYLFTEIATGLLFVFTGYHFHDLPSILLGIILSSLVVIIFVSDMKYMIILDSPLIISAILIFGIQAFSRGWSVAFFSLLYGFFTFLTMFLIGKLGNVMFKKESLGGGDIKLSFLFGMVLGYPMGIVAIVLSTFLALPYAFGSLFLSKNHELPFGPFLVFSLWLVFFYYDKFSNIFSFLMNI